ncbi:sodium:solute symporter [Campylobacter sp. RM16192]|uniref:sodium:solute symporter n=1 Tax=Campylobacter sp. RM16192 TaxID=1660080 RepID=UPI001451CD67|nr:sodium:solute symporter [Campylobacter sp. RM16192]QCD53137.1 Na+/solute symporter [Campylobacter sp. RM16192]
MEQYTGAFFWGFLIVYGVVMYIFSPKARSVGSFFRGESVDGAKVSPFLLTTSIFISWIFAKSVTNAANLGASYGIVGGVAYATYWLCIPIAGFVIFRLRRKFGATGLVQFLTSNYGIAASLAFCIAILIRLFNEVWSNTAVVGGYYGDSGSTPFILAASIFTLFTLIYSVRGGLRGSIVTDIIQALVFTVATLWVIMTILPKHGIVELANTGKWALNGGVDLLLVAILQLVSYPFHDPVLTDRGFISEEKTMFKSFIISGILGFLAILIFSFIGIYGTLEGIAAKGNIPAELAKTMGFGSMFLMTAVMIAAAGSTLDSTFSSLSKLVGYDIPSMANKTITNTSIKVGIISMILFAVFGNLPMIVGTDILKATTISGTMVIGLAPVFLLHGVVKPTKLGFHISFWLGIGLGVAYAFNAKFFPDFIAIGYGKYAMLLGINLYGLILCTLGYILPGLACKCGK